MFKNRNQLEVPVHLYWANNEKQICRSVRRIHTGWKKQEALLPVEYLQEKELQQPGHHNDNGIPKQKFVEKIGYWSFPCPYGWPVNREETFSVLHKKKITAGKMLQKFFVSIVDVSNNNMI
jgi:hypothetical protein